jgi:hypothetical protein
MIMELHRMMKSHMREEASLMGPLKDLAILWKASKLLGMLFTGLAALVAAGWQAAVWARDHFKW